MSDTSLTLRCWRRGGGLRSLVPARDEHDHRRAHDRGPGGDRAHDVTAALVRSSTPAGDPPARAPSRSLPVARTATPGSRPAARPSTGDNPSAMASATPAATGVRSRIVSSSVSGTAPAASRLRARRTARGRSTDRKAVHSRFTPGMTARPAARRGERRVGLCSRLAQGADTCATARPASTGQGWRPTKAPSRAGRLARGAAPLRRRVFRGRHGPRSLCGRTRKSGVCLSPAPEKAWGDGKDVVAPRKRRSVDWWIHA